MQLDHPATLDLLDLLAIQDLLDPLDHRVHLEIRVNLEMLEHQDPKVHKEMQVLLEIQDHKDLLVHLEMLGKMDHLVSQGLPVVKEIQGSQVPQDP